MKYTILTVQFEHMMQKDLKNTNKKLIDAGHTPLFSESKSESNHSPLNAVMLHYAQSIMIITQNNK